MLSGVRGLRSSRSARAPSARRCRPLLTRPPRRCTNRRCGSLGRGNGRTRVGRAVRCPGRFCTERVRTGTGRVWRRSAQAGPSTFSGRVPNRTMSEEARRRFPGRSHAFCFLFVLRSADPLRSLSADEEGRRLVSAVLVVCDRPSQEKLIGGTVGWHGYLISCWRRASATAWLIVRASSFAIAHFRCSLIVSGL